MATKQLYCMCHGWPKGSAREKQKHALARAVFRAEGRKAPRVRYWTGPK